MRLKIVPSSLNRVAPGAWPVGVKGAGRSFPPQEVERKTQQRCLCLVASASGWMACVPLDCGGDRMRWTSGFACAVVLGCLSCGAQTNCCPATLIKFAIEPLRLRPDTRQESHEIKPFAPVVANLPVSKPGASFETGLHGAEFQSRVIRPGEFYLRQAAPASDNSIIRFVDGVFRPEVIQLSKVQMTCPFWTALKRKNPLCLLSGLSPGVDTADGGIAFKVLELSW